MYSPANNYNPLTGVFVAPIAPIIGQENMSFLSNSKAALSIGIIGVMFLGFSAGKSFSPTTVNNISYGTFNTETGKILEKFITQFHLLRVG
jgi:hypothetical protein